MNSEPTLPTEREFLHQLSSPVSAAILISQILTERHEVLQKDKLAASLHTMNQELEKVRSLILNRRRELDARNTP